MDSSFRWNDGERAGAKASSIRTAVPGHRHPSESWEPFLLLLHHACILGRLKSRIAVAWTDSRMRIGLHDAMKSSAASLLRNFSVEVFEPCIDRSSG